MATVITAPERVGAEALGLKVYLGGAIDMGDAVNWQAAVIEKLEGKPGLILLNPRRKEFTQETQDEQIKWELKALQETDIILMWFPKDAAAPISFLETGLYMNSRKLVVGAEKGFYRRRNLELTCKFYGVRLWETLDQLMKVILQSYEEYSHRL